MSEKKYTIFISCIACLLAFVLALCSVTVSHAEESELFDDNWSYWHFLDNDSSKNGQVDSFGKEVPWTKVEYPDISDFDSKDIYNFNTLDNTWSTELRAFSFACKDEVSGYIEQQSDGQYIVRIMCLSAPTIKANVYSLNGKDAFAQTSTNLSYTNWAGGRTSTGDYYIYFDLLAYSTTRAGGIVLAINPQNIKFYDSVDHCYDHLKNGSDVGRIMDNAPKQTYSPELLLNDFDVQFHDSNKFEECYLDVKYTIPDSFKSVSSFQIDMEERFDWIGTISGSVSDVTDSHTGTNYIDVLNHADGFRIYLKDIKAIDNFINKYDGAFDKALKRFVLGNLNYVNFPFSKYIIGTVKTSNLNIKFHLVAEKKYGHYVDYNLNLLSGVGVKNSYVPDTEGNYTSNNDTKVMGHYYADVGTDAAGNTTYNYYYYYSDGGKEKISAEDATNNTVTSTIENGAIRIENNPVFNNNITVEGDNIRNEANSYADSKSDSSTNKSFIDKFLGFFDIIENNTFLGVFAKVFGWLPVGVSSLITTALGIVVGIRVFKFFK